jgi:hypothetical protein
MRRCLPFTHRWKFINYPSLTRPGKVLVARVCGKCDMLKSHFRSPLHEGELEELRKVQS